MCEIRYNTTKKSIFEFLYLISYYITHFSLIQVRIDMKKNIKILIGENKNSG